MATIVSKGPYYWDVRGSFAGMAAFTQQHIDTIPQGSSYLVTEGNHDIYIWNAEAKKWEVF